MDFPLLIPISDLCQLQALGVELGKLLCPGMVVGLQGLLGSGKTTLVRAIAVGLGCKHPEFVTSPTYVLVQEYSARCPIFHMDAYRLKNPRDFLEMGGLEAFDPEGVLLVEWEEKIRQYLPINRIHISLVITGEASRTMEVSGQGGQETAVLEKWTRSFINNPSFY